MSDIVVNDPATHKEDTRRRLHGNYATTRSRDDHWFFARLCARTILKEDVHSITTFANSISIA